MKKKFILSSIFMLTGWLAFAQQHDAGIVKLRGTRLTYPLVNKWIEEFSKEYPGVKVSIAPAAPADSIDFNIASYALTSKELEGNKEAVVVTRYIQLPVAQRPGLALLQEKGLTEKNLSDLFLQRTRPPF
jgi:phosphate transport system substrate-binding protein